MFGFQHSILLYHVSYIRTFSKVSFPDFDLEVIWSDCIVNSESTNSLHKTLNHNDFSPTY